ncbi:MAG: tetratricopeptide repeat protein [Gammaproteobacteria bacterium]|jgi:tetratricopeptide (TPR) repeat protein
MQNAPSRNAPCPCGSGKKYKRCCGADDSGHQPAANRDPHGLQQLLAHYRQGNYQAAASAAEQLLRTRPATPAVLEIAAAAALLSGDTERAVERFRQQIQLQPDNALARSNLCMALHTLGRDEEAFVHGQEAIRLDPKLADAWNNLGNIFKAGNHLQGALEHYEKALALDGSDPRVHVNAGSVSQLLGDLETAGRRYRDALKLSPDFASAHNNLGTVLQKLGEFDAAGQAFRSALRLQPRNPETLTNQASLWLEQGEIDKAQSRLEEVIRDYPEYAGAYVNLGYLHEKRNDEDAANRCYQKALLLEPENSTVLCNLAYILFEQGEQKDAEAHFVRALKSNPNSAKALAGLGRTLLRQNDQDEAAQYIEQSLQLAPRDVHAHIARAQLAIDRGDAGTARKAWEQVIELQPVMCEGYIGLARMAAEAGDITAARDEFRRAEAAGATTLRLYQAWSDIEEKNNNLEAAERAAEQAVEINPAYPGLAIIRAKLARRRKDYNGALALLERVNPDEFRSRELTATYLFELGGIHDKLGNYRAAFSAFDRANAEKNIYIGKVYEAEADAERFRQWSEFFDSTHWEQWRTIPRPAADERPCPVFIVGFPRSGTSLLEQILDSHAQIAAAGELTYIRELSQATGDAIIGSRLTYPYNLLDPDAPLDAGKLVRLRDFYLDSVRALNIADPETRWITDKMPHNAIHLGLISLLFPEAPIIHISRHPLDSCLSAYFSNFNSAHRYTSSLADTARHYRLVMEMLDHYRTTTPGIRYLEIHYEQLIEDQETVVRQVLEFIGAPWDDACLQHHKSKRVVRTASYEQVTRQIYRTSLHRYRNYREAVQPLLGILEPVLSRFGYAME